MKISIIYRCCEGDLKKSFRPNYFSKENCLQNFLNVFLDKNVEIICVHDGACGSLYDILKKNNINTKKINENSNEKSLISCLLLAKELTKTDVIYFLEDDYLHKYESYDAIIDGFNLIKNNNNLSFLSLKDHPDRYTRTDDLDHGRTNVYLGNKHHWRTAESTTCTWAISQDDYLEFGFELAMKHGLNDRAFFREALTIGKRLITPIPGLSTHCHIPFMSPFVDWEKYK